LVYIIQYSLKEAKTGKLYPARKDGKAWNDLVQTTKTYVGMWSQYKIRYSKMMTGTAAQTTYFKSAATESKLFHVSDGVHGRCTRISSRIT